MSRFPCSLRHEDVQSPAAAALQVNDLKRDTPMTEVAPDQLMISAKPFCPLGHNSGLMLMTPFCPPRDEQTGAAHLPPDGA